MEFLFEAIMELYVEMAMIIVPEGKLKEWQEALLKIACIVVTTGIFVCLFVGIYTLVEEGGGTLGIVLTSVGGAVFVIQSVISVIVGVHKVKAEKAARANGELDELSKRVEVLLATDEREACAMSYDDTKNAGAAENRSAGKDVTARELEAVDYESEYTEVKSSELKPEDIVLEKAGEQIPTDGEVIVDKEPTKK